MELQIAILRNLAARIGVQPLREVAKSPGLKEAYRISVHYAGMRAPDSVTTIRCYRQSTPVLESVYLGFFNHKAIFRQVSVPQFEEFRRGLTSLRLDNLKDQPNTPLLDVDLWLVERAANGFEKSVLIAPANAFDVYNQIIELTRRCLPDAVRELQG